MTDKIVVLNTCSSEEEARKVGRRLVEARLAACVNIIGEIGSIYHWQGRIEDGREWLLLIKTRRELLPVLEQELRKEHSYKVPEILAIPVVDGLGEYLNWIDAETGTPSEA